MFKCHLINANAINQRCGYGEGKTWNEAVQNALKLALLQDKNAKIEGNNVVFSAGYNL